jgi:hypothetical protein
MKYKKTILTPSFLLKYKKTSLTPSFLLKYKKYAPKQEREQMWHTLNDA